MFGKFPNILPRFMNQSPQQRGRNQNPQEGRNGGGGGQCSTNSSGPSGSTLPSNKRRWMGDNRECRSSGSGGDQQVCQVRAINFEFVGILKTKLST